jgi:hypothetical protein
LHKLLLEKNLQLILNAECTLFVRKARAMARFPAIPRAIKVE